MTSATTERFHALDAVRATALLLGVLFHALFSFLPGIQIWPVADNQHSELAADLAFVLHVFRMTTFFVLAGFFAHMTFHKRGLWGFLWDRTKRIALPLVIFWPLVLAGIIACSIWAAVVANHGVMPKAPAAPPPAISLKFFPLTHLWFLYVLLIFYAVTLLVRGLVVVIDRQGGLRRGLDGLARLAMSPWVPVLLALPTVALLAVQKDWTGWFGVPTPDMSLIPNPTSMVAYGSAFTLGWFLHRRTDLLDLIQRRWALNLVLALGFIAAAFALIGGRYTLQPFTDPVRQAAFAAAYGLANWSATFALIGFALQFLSGHSPLRRWIADSSYWVYIVHLPLVMALQVLVSTWQMAWPLKLVVIVSVAMALMWGSYQLLVRHTVIGWLLNGPRPGRKSKKAAKPGSQPAASAAE